MRSDPLSPSAAEGVLIATGLDTPEARAERDAFCEVCIACGCVFDPRPARRLHAACGACGAEAVFLLSELVTRASVLPPADPAPPRRTTFLAL